MFENNLKECREDLGLTQTELGYVLGVHYSTVSGWEIGRDTMPLSKLVLFANMYNLSLDYIVGLARGNKEYKEKIKLNKENIGKRLKSIRKELKLTQKEMAESCDIAQNTYSNYENGVFLIKILPLYTFCKNHNISMDLIIR